MRFPRTSAAACRLPVLVLLGLAGCSSAGSMDGGPGAMLDAAVPDLSPTPDLRRVRDLTPPPTGSVKGVILDEDGSPLAGVAVQACSARDCLYVNSGQDGSFEADGASFGWRAVKSAQDDSKTPRWAEAVSPVLIDVQGRVYDVGNIYVPRLPAGADLGPDTTSPQTLDAGDGVTVTLVRGNLDVPLGSTDQNVAARLVPLGHLPTAPARFDTTDEILQAVAFFPYGLKSSTPMAVTVPLSLPAGTAVKFVAVSEIDGTLIAPVSGHEAADGQSASTDAGLGIDRLTWLLVTR